MNSLGFIGSGRWALALAANFQREGLSCSLWEANKAALNSLEETRRHPDFPEDCAINEKMVISGELAEVLAGADIAVFAVPSNSLTEVARLAKPLLTVTTRAIVTVTKGIDPTTLRRVSIVLSEVFPDHPVVVLAGPGIPWDFALGDPTTLVAASEHMAAADTVRDCLSVGNLRVYSSSDVVGVEIAAAMKNVIAIAAGIADGLGLGINAKAALLTRGLAEMTRLGLGFNANPMTFAGLAGMGDLIVTACSEKSRNHTLGRLIGSGLTLDEALARLHGVAEGAITTRSALALASRLRIELPITEQVNEILFHNGDSRKSMRRLLGRKPKREDGL